MSAENHARLPQWLLWLLLLAFVAAGLESMGALVLHGVLGDQYVQGRAALLGRGAATREGASQNVTGLAYLNYIPTPNYRPVGGDDYDGPLHNAHGYKGPLVPLERKPRTLRVLCLGGSTTYDSLVNHPTKTYPGQLEAWLEAALGSRYDDVEVINGGVHFASSAELLTCYQFKFHYYQPDVVVIDAGGNDAAARVAPYYQPDYSHWRAPLVGVKALPTHSRWLAHSRLASALILHLFYYDQLHGNQFLRTEGTPPPAPWFGEEAYPNVPVEADAFRHNLETLLEMIVKDGARIVLVPFRAAPQNQYPEELRAVMAQNEATLRELAGAYNAALAPFPEGVISPENWMDNCHTNAAGSAEKAAHIGLYVLNALDPGGP